MTDGDGISVSLTLGKPRLDARGLADLRREAERIASEIPDDLVALWESHPEEHNSVEKLDMDRDRCEHPDCASVHAPHHFKK